MKFYSQNGEDHVISSVFSHRKEPGFFVDVGALDGKVFSNTYGFELEGWKGICIEAHPDYVPLLEKNRPNSTVIHAAISHENQDTTTFYANKRGALSTLVGNLRKQFKEKYKRTNPAWVPIQVPMRTLTSVLDEVQPPAIDFVSIDIEGGEIAALRGFDFEKYRPRVFVIEAIDKKREKITAQVMREVGYNYVRKISNNLFFCRDDRDGLILLKTSRKCKLVRTQHPCDVKR